MAEPLQLAALVDPRRGVARWVFLSRDPEAYAKRPPAALPKPIREWLRELRRLKRSPSYPEVLVRGPIDPEQPAGPQVQAWAQELYAQGADLLNDIDRATLEQGGRPTVHTPEIAEAICSRIAAGETLKSICEDPAMPGSRTVYGWMLRGTHPDFERDYALAKRMFAAQLFDEQLEIADKEPDDHVQVAHARLRIETRSKMLGYLDGRYHPRSTVSLEGNPEAPVTTQLGLPPLTDELEEALGKHIRRALQGQAPTTGENDE